MLEVERYMKWTWTSANDESNQTSHGTKIKGKIWYVFREEQNPSAPTIRMFEGLTNTFSHFALSSMSEGW